MNKNLFKNVGLKLVSVLIAFVIWILVVNNNDPERTVAYSNIKVQIENKSSVAANDKVFEVKNSTDTVTVYVTDRKSVTRKLQASDFEVKADLENINDMMSVPLTVRCTNRLVNVKDENIRVEPSSLKIKLEDKVERAFAIKAKTSGNPSNGYQVGDASVKQGDSVIIAGSSTLLDKIDKVIAPVSISGMSGSRTLTADIKIVDKNGTDFTESQMQSLEIKTSDGVLIANNQVDVAVVLWKVQNNIKLSALTSGRPASGYQVSGIEIVPDTISLAGTETALKSLNGVLTLAEEISVEGATSDLEQKLDLAKTLEGYKGLNLETDAATTVTVKVKIEKLGTKSIAFPIANLDIVGAAENFEMVLTPTDKLQITVAADAENLNTLTEADIKANLDLSAYTSAGTYTVPVEVILPEGYEQVGDVNIVVNLKSSNVERATEG